MPEPPGHREVSMRLFAGAAPERSAELARALLLALGDLGAVTVNEMGPYWKLPEDLQFTVAVRPTGQVTACARELIARSGPRWRVDEADAEPGFYDATWNREPGGVLLHPAVNWAHLVSRQAPRPPKFRLGEIVRVRADGRRLWVAGSGPGRDGEWGYSIQPLEDDMDPEEFMPHIVEGADEEDLESTGRFVAAAGEPPRFVSVDDEGRIPGWSS